MRSVKSLRIPDELLRAARDRARREHVDESDALRHLIALGAVEYAVRLYQRGEVSLRKAANLAGLRLWDMLDEVWRRGIGDNLSSDDAQDAIDSTLEVYERLKTGRKTEPPRWVVMDSGKDDYRKSSKKRRAKRKKAQR